MEQPEDHLHSSCHHFSFATERHLIDHLLIVDEVLHLKLRSDWEEEGQHLP